MRDPRLSLCVPTHDGRAQTLAVALASVLSQLIPGVEICVSDNASRDGTEQLVAGLQSQHRGVIRYERSRLDRGGPANLLAAVSMARGEWCWLLSSDDALAPGALSAAAELLDRHPDVSGFTLGWRPYDRSLRTPDPGRWSDQPWNPGRSERVFSSTAELLMACGPLFDYMSNHVFRRTLWMGALADGDELITIFPTTLVFGRLAMRRPSWVWSPTSAVMTRMQNHDLLQGGGIDIARLRASVFDEVRRVWRAVLNDRRAERQMARKWVDFYLFDRQLHVDATHSDTTVRGQLRLIWSLFCGVGWSGWFWRKAIPVLAVPAPVGRRLPGLKATLRPYAELPASDCAAAISGELPAAIPAGASIIVRCEVRNLRSRPLRSRPPRPVHLAYRWFDQGGTTLMLEGARVLLDPKLPPRARGIYELPVAAPRTPGQYLLRISLVQESVRWFDDLVPASGCAATVAVTARSDLAPLRTLS